MNKTCNRVPWQNVVSIPFFFLSGFTSCVSKSQETRCSYNEIFVSTDRRKIAEKRKRPLSTYRVILFRSSKLGSDFMCARIARWRESTLYYVFRSVRQRLEASTSFLPKASKVLHLRTFTVLHTFFLSKEMGPRIIRVYRLKVSEDISHSPVDLSLPFNKRKKSFQSL